MCSTGTRGKFPSGDLWSCCLYFGDDVVLSERNLAGHARWLVWSCFPEGDLGLVDDGAYLEGVDPEKSVEVTSDWRVVVALD